MNTRLAASTALAVWAVLAVAGVARADVPTALVEGVEDADLRERLETAIGTSENAPETRFDARRRAREAAEDATALLRSEGYYGATVEGDVPDAEPPVAVVRVTPGPRFGVASADVVWLETPPDPDSAAVGRAAVELRDGEPGRAADIIAAEGRIVAALTEQGYADAVAGDRRVVVDHAVREVRPLYRIDSGRLVRLDGIELDQVGRTRPAYVRRLAPWTAGEVYDPEDVAELERRLLDTGVYDTVTVALAPRERTTADGLRPVIVSLADRPSRVLELGAGYASDEGLGVDGQYSFYNRFGRAATVTFPFRLSEREQRAGATALLPHWRTPAENLRLFSEVFNEQTDAFDRAGLLARAELQRRRNRFDFYTYGVEAEVTRNEEVRELRGRIVPDERDIALVAGLAGITLDRSDDPFDPTRGWRVVADAQPTAAFGDGALFFLRAQAQGTLYVPVQDDAKTVVAGRLKIGSIVGGEIPDVPSARRFYAGGGGSVRGYEYQAIGPKLPDTTPTGGLSLFEVSVEARRRFDFLGGRLSGAAFVDGGSVSEEEYPTFEETQWAAGVGVRFDLGFAPVRADIAFPLNREEGQPAFQLYVGIGQAF